MILFVVEYYILIGSTATPSEFTSWNALNLRLNFFLIEIVQISQVLSIVEGAKLFSQQNNQL
jgi:hypothetical protein